MTRTPKTRLPENLRDRSRTFTAIYCDRVNVQTNRPCMRLLAEVFHTDELGLVLVHPTGTAQRATERLRASLRSTDPTGDETKTFDKLYTRTPPIGPEGKIATVKVSSPDIMERHGDAALDRCPSYFTSAQQFLEPHDSVIVVCPCRSMAGNVLSLSMSYVVGEKVRAVYGQQKVLLSDVLELAAQLDSNFVMHLMA